MDCKPLPIEIIAIKSESTKKKEYRTPVLEHLGDIRSVVLGGTPGPTESGGLGFTADPLHPAVP